MDKESNVHFLHIAKSDKPVQYYSLDVGKKFFAYIKMQETSPSDLLSNIR